MEGRTELSLIHQTTPVVNGCNKVDNGGCSHVCLAKHNNGRTCLCPDDLILDVDQQTCVEDDYSCEPGQIKCRANSTCLDPQQICDDHIDCPNKIDEQNCPAKCTTGHFRCSDGKCIPTRWMCDGTVDCVNGTDEQTENCIPQICTKRQFRCSEYLCEVRSVMCDHFEDCPNGADEKNCTDKCPPGHFQCDDGWCIAEDKNCDGIQDCADKSDEVECPGSECATMNGNCSHKCESLGDQYSCSCFKDYELAADNRTCHAKGVRPYLLVANYKGIHRISTNGQTGQTSLVDSNTPVLDIDIIMETGTIIWSTYNESTNTATIHTVTGKQSHIVLEKTGYICSLAVDWITRVVYYTSYTNTTGTLGCCHVDSGFCTTLVTKPDWTPMSLAVHPLKGLLYWVDKEEERLLMSYLDGSYPQILVDSQLYNPVNLVIDYVKNALYWIDDFFSWMKTYDLDSDNPRTVRQTLFQNPKSLDVFENVGYVSDLGGISRVGLYYGETNIMSRITNPTGLKIVHPLKQIKGLSLCKTKSCQYLCVNIPNAARCLCPDNFTPNTTDGNCYDSAGKLYVLPPALKQPSTTVLHHAPIVAEVLDSQNTQPELPEQGLAEKTTQNPKTNKATIKLQSDHNAISKTKKHKIISHTKIQTKIYKMVSNKTKKCSLNCTNGGFCMMTAEGMKCNCPLEFTGSQCESVTASSSTSPQPLDAPAHTEDDSDSNLWIIGLILGLVLIIVFVSGLVYYLRSRNKDVSLVSMIKYRNPNLGKRGEEVEELVPEISFNNPSFQDCDDKPPLPPRNAPICRNLYNITPKNRGIQL